jgi:hypothetical protein
MLAHALLDSNAFAMAFRYAVFSADDKYLRYVYGRGADMVLVFPVLISSLPI